MKMPKRWGLLQFAAVSLDGVLILLMPTLTP